MSLASGARIGAFDLRAMVVALAVGGCAEGTTGVDVITADEGGRRLETLSVLLGLRVAEGSTGRWADHVGRYFHPSHVGSPNLRVNGAVWGPLDNADAGPAPEGAERVGGYLLLDTPSSALLVGDLGRVSAADPASLRTVGDWVELLGRYLGVGSYVVDLTDVSLEGGEAVEHTALGGPPRVSLEVVEGEVAKHLGELVLELRMEDR